MAEARDPQTGLFVQGVSGNPKGRPKGSRNKLGEAFVAALQADFDEHGEEVIERVRAEEPSQYLKVIASILPKDLNVNINPLEDASDEELIQRLHDLEASLRPFLGVEGGRVDQVGDTAPLPN